MYGWRNGGRGRGRRRQIREARLKLFTGLYDETLGLHAVASALVCCPRCRNTVGNVTGAGWRQSRCDTCGSSLWLRQLDRGGRPPTHPRLLNPGNCDDDPIARRFAQLEIE